MAPAGSPIAEALKSAKGGAAHVSSLVLLGPSGGYDPEAAAAYRQTTAFPGAYGTKGDGAAIVPGSLRSHFHQSQQVQQVVHHQIPGRNHLYFG